MFKWLADMLVKTPVQGTCACCEGKKRQLQKNAGGYYARRCCRRCTAIY